MKTLVAAFLALAVLVSAAAPLGAADVWNPRDFWDQQQQQGGGGS